MMWSVSTSIKIMIQSYCPDIMILMIGDNDVFFDTDCEGLAGRLVSLATIFFNRGLAQHVIITRLMPRFDIPRCLPDIIQGNTMREKKDRYLSMYSVKTDLISRLRSGGKDRMYPPPPPPM